MWTAFVNISFALFSPNMISLSLSCNMMSVKNHQECRAIFDRILVGTLYPVSLITLVQDPCSWFFLCQVEEKVQFLSCQLEIQCKPHISDVQRRSVLHILLCNILCFCRGGPLWQCHRFSWPTMTLQEDKSCYSPQILSQLWAPWNWKSVLVCTDTSEEQITLSQSDKYWRQRNW